MKTNEEILARYSSDESDDFFGAQKSALLCMLPLEIAAPYLNPAYVEASKDGSLPEDERWVENFDVKEQVLEVIPDLYEAIKLGDMMHAVEGLLYLKAWIWATDTEFHDVIHPMYEGPVDDSGSKDLTDLIAKHYNYQPTIEDVDFEEIEEDKKE